MVKIYHYKIKALNKGNNQHVKKYIKQIDKMLIITAEFV